MPENRGAVHPHPERLRRGGRQPFMAPVRPHPPSLPRTHLSRQRGRTKPAQGVMPPVLSPLRLPAVPYFPFKAGRSVAGAAAQTEHEENSPVPSKHERQRPHRKDWLRRSKRPPQIEIRWDVPGLRVYKIFHGAFPRPSFRLTWPHPLGPVCRVVKGLCHRRDRSPAERLQAEAHKGFGRTGAFRH